MCAAGITAREFIAPGADERASRLDRLRDVLSAQLSVKSSSVNVFSLTDVGVGKLDVRFCVFTDAYLRPERLHGHLSAHKHKVGYLRGEREMNTR